MMSLRTGSDFGPAHLPPWQTMVSAKNRGQSSGGRPRKSGKEGSYLLIDIESDQAASVTAATHRARGKSVNSAIARIPRKSV